MRAREALRRLVRETDLAPRHLIAPRFVKEGIEEPMAIASMPGEPHLEFLVRGGGRFADALRGLQVGDTVEVSEPMGSS